MTTGFDRFSDEYLVWAAQYGSPGDKNSAPIFMTVPVEQRARVNRVAHTIMNVSPGFNYSGAVWEAARQLKAVDWAETGPERYAREDRERQQAERDARFADAAAILRFRERSAS